jgi:hypothetical protein
MSEIHASVFKWSCGHFGPPFNHNQNVSTVFEIPQYYCNKTVFTDCVIIQNLHTIEGLLLHFLYRVAHDSLAARFSTCSLYSQVTCANLCAIHKCVCA